jgi:hypothetical protein
MNRTYDINDDQATLKLKLNSTSIKDELGSAEVIAIFMTASVVLENFVRANGTTTSDPMQELQYTYSFGAGGNSVTIEINGAIRSTVDEHQLRIELIKAMGPIEDMILTFITFSGFTPEELLDMVLPDGLADHLRTLFGADSLDDIQFMVHGFGSDDQGGIFGPHAEHYNPTIISSDLLRRAASATKRAGHQTHSSSAEDMSSSR